MRRASYILLIFLQVGLVLFSSTLEWMNKEETSQVLASAYNNKKLPPTFIESDLNDSECLIYTQARERDTRPVEFSAEEVSYSPWTPHVFISRILLMGGEARSKVFLSLLLTDLPPPSLV